MKERYILLLYLIVRMYLVQIKLCDAP